MLLVAAPPVSAATLQTLVDNGDSSNRVDITIVGDGYTSAELGLFGTDAQALVDRLFAQAPFDVYTSHFNVHRVSEASAQSGGRDSATDPKDIAFDSYFNCAGIARLLCANSSKVYAALASVAVPDMYDIVVVLVNDARYGGAGGALAVASTNTQSSEIVLHELGHSFGLLADEYTTQPPTCSSASEPVQVNATKETDRNLVKWAAWIDPGTPVPTTTTTPATPGIYEGARYCPTGLYRPTSNSKMRSLYQPFEQINSEQLIRRIYNFMSPIDSVDPPVANVGLAPGELHTFSVVTNDPSTHTLDVSWEFDGTPVGTGPSFDVDSNDVQVGSHTLEAIVTDPTALVLTDPDGILTDRYQWSLGGVACGDGFVSGTEECDDGNTQPGDCCAGDCTFESSGSPCTDSDLCTEGSTCDAAGVCGVPVTCDDASLCTADSCDPDSGCVYTPALPPACQAAARADLKIGLKTPASKNFLKMKLQTFSGAVPNLGDPVSTTAYEFCLFDGSGVLRTASSASIQAGPDWKAKPGVKVQYNDKTGTADGVIKIRLSVSRSLRTKGRMLARGELFNAPAPLGSSMLGASPTFVFANDVGACWQAGFDSTAVRRNDADKFTARY